MPACETYTTDELAKALGISRATIQRQLRSRTFPIPALPMAGPRRWSRAIVHQWIESNGAGSRKPRRVA